MEPQPIACRAAVVFGPQQPFQVTLQWREGAGGSEQKLSLRTVIVAPPKAGEVRVKVLYAAPCQTDEHTRTGGDPEGRFPCILGHEAAGVVEAVGEGVETCRVGDPVAECFPSDREKKTCLACEGYSLRKTNLCQKIRAFTGRGVMKADGLSRFKLQKDNSTIFHFMGVSAFSEYTVVHQESVATVCPTAPLDRVCLLGCGVATGLGAVWKANVERGSSVAVFGIGAVGLACIDAARIAGASKIVAIDRNRGKEAMALRFGATDFLCPLDFHERDMQSVIVELFNGGVDFAFECTGSVSVMRAAFECTKKGWGICVILGVARAGEERRNLSRYSSSMQQLSQRRGYSLGQEEGRDGMLGRGRQPPLPWLLRLLLLLVVVQVLRGAAAASQSRVDEAFDLLRSGTCIRCVLQIQASERRAS
ncbi:hypothetical protein Efla_007230 [Eimeria flavescens]